jgi:hypothetical protein
MRISSYTVSFMPHYPSIQRALRICMGLGRGLKGLPWFRKGRGHTPPLSGGPVAAKASVGTATASWASGALEIGTAQRL